MKTSRSSAPSAFLGLAIISVAILGAQQKGKPKFNTWHAYLGGADSSQYSSLDQINKKNVAQLQVAWTFPTGDTRTYRFNPVIVDGVMYVLAKNMALVALTRRRARKSGRTRTRAPSATVGSITGRAPTGRIAGCSSSTPGS